MADLEYLNFVQHVEDIVPDTLDLNEEIPATPQEIGWWKQHQIRRAIHHARYGKATPVEIRLLKNHDVPVSSQAIGRTKKSM